MYTILKSLLCFTFAVTIVIAKIPSYIHICGRRNPHIETCLEESVMALTEKLRIGIPELEIPPMDPFMIDSLELANAPSFKAYANNATISGLSVFKINHLEYDINNLRTHFDVTFKELQMNGSYVADARILINFKGTGKVYIDTRNLNTKVTAQFKTVMRHGVKYVYVESITTAVRPEDYNVEFEIDGENTLYDALRSMLRDNHQELMEVTIPNLERAISEECVTLGNKICKHFTFDELFPDTE